MYCINFWAGEIFLSLIPLKAAVLASSNSFLRARLDCFTLSSVASSKKISPRPVLSTAYIPRVEPNATAAASCLVAPCANISEYTSVLDIIAIYARDISLPKAPAAFVAFSASGINFFKAAWPNALFFQSIPSGAAWAPIVVFLASYKALALSSASCI